MPGDALATLPNVVSFSRLGMAALFVMLSGSEERLLLIAAAGATDFVDGYLARTRGTMSRLGALIDPIADRGFVLAAVLSLLAEHMLHAWQCAVLLSRDIVTGGGFLLSRAVPRFRAVTFRARPAGKVVTVLQLATLALVFLAPRWVESMLVPVGVASAVSIGDYTKVLWQARARA